MSKGTKPTNRSGSGPYKVAGRLSDGVTVLEPKTKPTHFTSRQIRETITEVRREAASGRFVELRNRSPKKG